MSELHIVFDGEQSPGKIPVFGKKRFVTPFIGVIEREYGPHERGVGVKCPNQEKLIFHAVDSSDPLHYLRAFKLLCEIGELNDSILEDCIIATKDERRLENFSQTYVFKNSGDYRRSRFFDAQRRVMDFKPSPEDIRKVVDGFAHYLAPLETRELSHQVNEGTKLSHPIVRFEQPETMLNKADRPCYKPLVHALESSMSQAMPSAA